MRFSLVFILMIIPMLSMADTLQKQFEHEFVKLHKRTAVELCQVGCETEITDIWTKYNANVDKNNKRFNKEQVRCNRKCEQLQ